MSNTVPITTAILGYILLNEVLTYQQQMCLFGGFAGVVVLMITGSHEKTLYDDSHGYKLFALIVLICVPIGISFGFLCQRFMRELNFYTAGAYISLCCIPIYSI